VKPVAIVQDNHNFWQEVWQEAEPIVAHAIVVLLLETSLLLIGLLAWLLEHLFPKQEVYFSWIEKVDIWTALALLSMFGVTVQDKITADIHDILIPSRHSRAV
jgi:hypothetical protein